MRKHTYGSDRARRSRNSYELYWFGHIEDHCYYIDFDYTEVTHSADMFASFNYSHGFDEMLPQRESLEALGPYWYAWQKRGFHDKIKLQTELQKFA